MTCRIVRATHGNTRCRHCEQPIALGAARVFDSSHPGDYHLDCAVQVRHELVRKALRGDPLDAGLVPDVALLRRRIRERAAEVALERRAAAIGPPDPVLDPLFTQLESDPDDRAVAAVLADVLAMRGELHGELITAELTAIARPAAVVPARRRDELRARLTPSFGDVPVKLTWACGFIEHLAISPMTAPRLARLAACWRHGSLRLLRSLSVTGPIGPLGFAWFPCLRVFEQLMHAAGPIDDVIAMMPRLEQLALRGPVGELELAHPSLRVLDTGNDNAHVLATLDPAELPALRDLTTVAPAPLIAAMLERGWADRLDRLAIVNTQVGRELIDALASAGRKLPHLDLSQASFAGDVAALRRSCERLDLVLQPAAGMTVRHRARPEWGGGVVVAVSPGKVTIAFANAGTRTLRDTLPELIYED